MEDFSQDYLEMCDKAMKLQKNWEPEEWDYFIEKGNYETVHRVNIVLSDKQKAEYKEKFSWIPGENEIDGKLIKGRQKFVEDGFRLCQKEIDRGTYRLKDSHKKDMKIRDLVCFERKRWDDNKKEWG